MMRFRMGAALAVLLALASALTACGGTPHGDRTAGMRGMSDPQSMEGTHGMSGMPGASQQEGMTGGSARAEGDTAGVPVNRAAAERIGVTFARAAMRPVAAGARVVGTLEYAEPRRVYVNARVMGWVEKLYADYEGKPVRKGDALLALYAPDLLSSEEEYLTARRLGDSSLVAAARRRLTLWDVPEDQIALFERTGRAQRTVLLRAPIGGEIAEKMVTEGQAVREGDNLFLIADRSVLWAELAVYESDARMLHRGDRVQLTVNGLPEHRYEGRVTFIHPAVDTATRTLTARVEVLNRGGRLRPGMYVTAELASAAQPRLTVPLTAVLPTGTRQLVFVNRGDGEFVPREVTTGARNDSLVEVAQGLKVGDEVIGSATYLLDSESNLASAMQGLMLQMGMGLNMGGMQGMEGTGRKNSGKRGGGRRGGKEQRP